MSSSPFKVTSIAGDQQGRWGKEYDLGDDSIVQTRETRPSFKSLTPVWSKNKVHHSFVLMLPGPHRLFVLLMK